MASNKQKRAWSRMKSAARACKGKKKTAFRACMRKKLKKKRK